MLRGRHRRQDDGGNGHQPLPYTYRHGYHGNVSGSLAGILDCLCQDSSVYRYPGRHADVQGTFQCGASGDDAGSHTGPVSGAVQYLCAGFLCCGGL